MHLTAYCDIGFLDKATRAVPAGLVAPGKLAESKYHHDLLELIAYGLRIKTNATKEEIDRRLDNPYITHLVKNFRIEPADTRMAQISLNDGKFFEQAGRDVAVYFVSDLYSSLASAWEEQSGSHFVTASSPKAALFAERYKDFAPGTAQTWEFAREMLLPHHSIAIADPYLFKERTLDTLAGFLKTVVPKKLKGRYSVTLIGANNVRGFSYEPAFVARQIEQRVRPVLAEALANYSLEYHFNNDEDFHDRYIITNNTCVFSGYGIDTVTAAGQSKKDSTWIAAKPFKRVAYAGHADAFFLRIVAAKLDVMRKWIKRSHAPATSNPLFG